MRREPQRWSTPFGSWVRSYGVPRLVRDLSAAGQPVTLFAVHKWIAGSHAPRPERASAIESLSGGVVSIREIYAHRDAVRAGGGSVERTS